jgi:hypothetical protein
MINILNYLSGKFITRWNAAGKVQKTALRRFQSPTGQKAASR